MFVLSVCHVIDKRQAWASDGKEPVSEPDEPASRDSALLCDRVVPAGRRRYVRHQQINRLSDGAQSHCCHRVTPWQVRQVSGDCGRAATHHASLLQSVKDAWHHRRHWLHARGNPVTGVGWCRDLQKPQRFLQHQRAVGVRTNGLHHGRSGAVARIGAR